MPAPSASDPAAKPLRRDAERNRQRILAAAREVFAERGARVTLDDVAARAEVGVGTVYRRFADRNALIDALFAERVDALAEAATEAAGMDDAWAGLVHLFEAQVRFQLDDRAFAEVLFLDQAGDAGLATARERLVPLVGAVLARAKEQGVVRPELELGDLPVLNLMLMTMVNATREVAPDAWRRYVPLVLAGIRADAELTLGAAAPSIEQVDELMRSGLARRI